MYSEQVTEVALLRGLLSQGVRPESILVLLCPAHTKGSRQTVSTVTHDLIGGELSNARKLEYISVSGKEEGAGRGGGEGRGWEEVDVSRTQHKQK